MLVSVILKGLNLSSIAVFVHQGLALVTQQLTPSCLTQSGLYRVVRAVWAQSNAQVAWMTMSHLWHRC